MGCCLRGLKTVQSVLLAAVAAVCVYYSRSCLHLLQPDELSESVFHQSCCCDCNQNTGYATSARCLTVSSL